MKKVLIYLFVVIASLLILILIPSTQLPAPMPWHITIMPDGNPQVLGIHLGMTSYRHAQILLKQYGETAIFIQQDEAPPAVEAFFNSVNLGGLSARLVLTLIVPEKRINAMLSRAREARLQPSGAYRYTPNNEDNAALINASVDTITYIPSITLHADIVQRRFGTPDYIETDKDDNSEQKIWYYHALGLNVYFTEQEKTILYYYQRRHK